MTRNSSVVFNEVPQGLPEISKTLKVQQNEIDLESVALNGGILVKNLYLSLDPYMRGRMRDPSIKSYTPAFDLGKPLANFAIARVERSENADYAKGDVIYHMAPFEEYSVVTQFAGVRNLAPILKEHSSIPLASFLGGCGMPGKTASWSFETIGQPKKGETVFISSAAGAVGQLVLQLAKTHGCYVIASAGSDEKVEFVKSLGADHAFNYKTNKIADELKKLGRGIDINFENVGADTLDTLLLHMNKNGRIILCGLAATYNGESYAYKNLGMVLINRLRMEGFIILDHPEWDERFYKEIVPLVASGKFELKEDITEGLENTEQAFINLLSGKNNGKAVVKLSD